MPTVREAFRRTTASIKRDEKLAVAKLGKVYFLALRDART
jgi:hypothetical protein